MHHLNCGGPPHQEEAELDNKDVERLRTVVVVKTFAQLLERNDFDSPEKLAKQTAEVRAFGKELFNNLRGPDKSR